MCVAEAFPIKAQVKSCLAHFCLLLSTRATWVVHLRLVPYFNTATRTSTHAHAHILHVISFEDMPGFLQHLFFGFLCFCMVCAGSFLCLQVEFLLKTDSGYLKDAGWKKWRLAASGKIRLDHVVTQALSRTIPIYQVRGTNTCTICINIHNIFDVRFGVV